MNQLETTEKRGYGKLLIFLGLVLCSFVLLLPFFACEPTASELNQINELQNRYYKVLPQERWQISLKIHYLGGHIDEGHERCQWNYYHNRWKITLYKLGLFNPFESE